MHTIIPPGRLTKSKLPHKQEKVLLITPPSPFLLDERVFLSLGILKIAAMLESAGHLVEVLDLSGVQNYEEVCEIHASQTDAGFVGITITTPQLPSAVRIVERIRKVRPELRIIAGGPHPTLVHSAVKLEMKAGRIGRAHSALEKLQSIFDVVVSGDGEFAIFQAISENTPKVIDADIPGGGLFMSSKDYETTPPPARHLVDLQSYKYSIEGHKATTLIAQLGCPYGCNFSLSGDSLVLTNHGFERMDSLVSGEGHEEICDHGHSVRVYPIDRKVYTANGLFSAESIVDEGMKKVFNVVLENGIEIKATEEHPFYVVEGDELVWKELHEIKVGDYLAYKIPDFQWPESYVKFGKSDVGFSTPNVNEEIGWLLGYTTGVDCFDGGSINSSNKHIFLNSLGISPTDIHIPDSIKKSPRSVVKAFVNGILHINPTKSVRTPKRDFAYELSNLILMLGNVPNIRKIRELDSISYEVSMMSDSRLTELRKTNDLTSQGLICLKVESISSHGVERIFDLRVPEEHNYLASGVVSHNCGGRNSKMLRSIRTRSTASILKEIEDLHLEHGYTGFNFFDDELNVNKSMIELMDGIALLQIRLGVEFRLRGFVKAELFNDKQAEAMYKAGFRWILSGFEAAHPRILENINKKATVEDNTRVLEIAKRHNLKVKALMSVGHAGETEESILAVRDWLLKVKPDDFDCTIITTYPGTPYFDEAIPHETLPGVWTYTNKKSGDKLHSYDVDYTVTADYYKGDPSGGYHSYVFTDHLSAERIVELRDLVENEVRNKLNIPFNPGAPGITYEHSMGQGKIPSMILRATKQLDTHGLIKL